MCGVKGLPEIRLDAGRAGVPATPDGCQGKQMSYTRLCTNRLPREYNTAAMPFSFIAPILAEVINS